MVQSLGKGGKSREVHQCEEKEEQSRKVEQSGKVKKVKQHEGKAGKSRKVEQSEERR